jgi:uncharacterized protein (TIGR01777 family)
MLGAALGRALAASGWQAVRLVRRPPMAENEIAWNPALEQPLPDPELLEGFDAAIHLSGANLAARRWSAPVKAELVSSRVDSTRALATLLSRLQRPPQTFITASAVGFYGDRGDEILDEGAAAGHGFLADLCRAWEAATQPAVEAGLRVLHLRTGVALASGEGVLARLAPLFRLGMGGRLGSGAQWMSWIAAEDWAAAVIFLLDHTELAGAINLVAPQPATNAAFTRVLARVLGRPALLPAPALALRLGLGEMAGEMLLASQRALPRKLLGAGFGFRFPSLEPALRFALQKSLRAGL